MSIARRRRRLRTGCYRNPIGIALFLLPGVGMYTLIVLYPTVMSFVYSVIRWQGLKPLWTFNGFGYYVQMAHDRYVVGALLNNLRAWALHAFVQVPIALLLAYVLSRRVRGAALFRFVYYIPQVTSVLLLALIFRFLLTADYGLNALLRAVGLGGLIRPWLSQDGLAQWVVNIPQTWAGVGFWVVIFLAAINGVSEELFEAAQLDGAGNWQQFLYVTIPGIRGVLAFSYVMAVIWALQAFLYQFLMPATPGGPINMTHTLASYIVYYVLNEGRTATNWGYASAMAVVLFLLCVGAALLVWRVSRWSGHTSGHAQGV